MPDPIPPGTQLQNRYHLIGVAGQGAWGQTYLGRDLQRMNQLCVLKELTPVQTDPAVLDNLQQQFNQCTATLYNLQHPQLPCFRPLFVHEKRLYWVRDYIDGKSYSLLLADRRSQGQPFSELDMIQFLEQTLPVLTYLHRHGIVHANLLPESIILRQADQLPVLINIGLVQELAAQLQIHPIAPEITAARRGYAPPEQRQAGKVFPNSDLYSLAAIVVTLLSGKEPNEISATRSHLSGWEAKVNISPAFAAILRYMLCPDPRQRAASADQVLSALNALGHPTDSVPRQFDRGEPEKSSSSALSQTGLRLARWFSNKQTVASTAMGIGIVVLLAAIAWKILSLVRPEKNFSSVPTASPAAIASNSADRPTAQPSSPLPSPSSIRDGNQDNLRDRRRQLEVDFQYFTTLVDDAFYSQNPQLRDRHLDSSVEQDKLRSLWNGMANDLLTKLEHLSPEVRRKLGTYRRATYDQWLKDLGEPAAASSPTLDALADARFYELLPDRKGKPLNPRTFGQIWYAIAEEQLNAAKTKKSAGTTPSNPTPH